MHAACFLLPPLDSKSKKKTLDKKKKYLVLDSL